MVFPALQLSARTRYAVGGSSSSWIWQCRRVLDVHSLAALSLFGVAHLVSARTVSLKCSSLVRVVQRFLQGMQFPADALNGSKACVIYGVFEASGPWHILLLVDPVMLLLQSCGLLCLRHLRAVLAGCTIFGSHRGSLFITSSHARVFVVLLSQWTN